MMTPVLFSVSYAGLWGQQQLDLKGFLRKAADLGYPAVELMAKRPHLSVLDYGPREVAELRSVADDLGLEIATLAGYTDFTLASGRRRRRWKSRSPTSGDWRKSRPRWREIVRIFTGYTTQSAAYQRDWETCVRAVRKCAGGGGPRRDDRRPEPS